MNRCGLNITLMCFCKKRAPPYQLSGWTGMKGAKGTGKLLLSSYSRTAPCLQGVHSWSCPALRQKTSAIKNLRSATGRTWGASPLYLKLNSPAWFSSFPMTKERENLRESKSKELLAFAKYGVLLPYFSPATQEELSKVLYRVPLWWGGRGLLV